MLLRTNLRTLTFILMSCCAPLACGGSGDGNDGDEGEEVNPEAGYLALNPSTAMVDTCTPTAIEHRGSTSYQLIPAPEAVAVASTSELSMYSDAACSSLLGIVTIAQGAKYTTVWFKSDEGAAATFNAEADGFPSIASVIINIWDEELTAKVAMERIDLGGTSMADPVAVGDCTPVHISQQSVEKLGSRMTSATEVVHTLSASAGALFSDAACTTAMPTATWVPGSAFALTWFKADAPGTATITATSSLGTGTLVLTAE
jgi:hypothetical protein